jgi:hypothetical protein
MCSVQFGKRGDLTNHLVNVNHKQKIRNFECSTCGRKFETINEFASHAASEHTIVIVQQAKI